MNAIIPQREPLRPRAYFDRDIAYEMDKGIPRLEAQLAAGVSDARHRASLRHTLFKKRLHLLLSCYSRGDAVEELVPMFPDVLDAFARYEAEPEQEPTDFDSLDDYQTSLWLVSLARVLRVPRPLFDTVVDLIGQNGQDPIYDAIVEGRAPAEGLVALRHPDPYAELGAAVCGEPPGTTAHLARFLKQWYGALVDAYWHDSHKGPEGSGFFGYWAVEAAGVVQALGLDDRPFRDLAHYPRDLAAFARH